MEAVVRLTATADVAYGEEILICGAAPALGSWTVADAAAMKWNEGGRWSLEVALPCGVTVELKVLIRQQAGTLRWIGIGLKQENNIVLETTIGRPGARPSRFTSEVPLALQVADIESGTAVTVPPATEHGVQPGASGPAGMGMPPQASPTALAPMGYAPFSPQEQEASAAAMLAGAAGAAGRAVTYTTTTTTTTAVTINGAWDSSAAGQAAQPAIVHPGAGPVPIGNALPAPAEPGCPRGPDGPGQAQSGGGGTGGGSEPQAEATPAQREAFIAARRKNDGLPRLGPAALHWPPSEGGAPEPSTVYVRGSWDGWARDLALEPAPGGGFRLMLVLPPGRYEFKYIVDGNWTTSDDMERTDCANKNNIVFANDMALAPFVAPALKDAAEEAPATSTALALAVGGN